MQKQRIYPRLSQVYYLLCRHAAYIILKKRLRYYMKGFFNRIAKISLGLFNFNSQSSAYIAASLAKRRFELKFSRKEVSMMLYHVTDQYVAGFYAIFAGRFTKSIRATKEQILFGKVSSNSIMAPIDYHQTTAIIRYGASSTKLQLAFQNYTLLGAISENHKSVFHIFRNRVLFFSSRFGDLIKKIRFSEEFNRFSRRGKLISFQFSGSFPDTGRAFYTFRRNIPPSSFLKKKTKNPFKRFSQNIIFHKHFLLSYTPDN